MNYFIIIRGPAGVGKTTIANLLTKSLHGFHVSIDGILVKHGLDYISGEPCVPEHKMLAANKIIIPIIKKKLAAEQIVILDGNFYHHSQIDDLIAAFDHPFFIFTLKADLETCLRRNTTRPAQLDEQGVREVFALVSKCDYGIVVDTNDKTVEKIMREIMVHIEKEENKCF